MAPDIQVSVDVLRRACTVLLDEVELRFGPDVALCGVAFDEDHYLTLTLAAAFELADRPELHVIAGQTSDDVDEVRALLDRPDGEVVLWHDLGHLAGVRLRIAYLDEPR